MPEDVMNAVRIPRFGDSSVLELVQVPEPEPGPGEVMVAVRFAGINPGEIPIREGRLGGEPPFGQGSDFAGDVVGIGAGVTRWSVGDEVIGMSDERSAQADYVTIAADRVVPKPPALAWEVAGSLYVVGTTAVAAVDAVAPQPGETVVVAGAAGGVGVLAAQLAKRAGARVIGTASERNHDALRDLGIEPVTYGDGVQGRIRLLASDGVDAFIDTHGRGDVDLALDLGVPPDRVETIADFEAASRGVHTVGMSSVADPAAAVGLLAQLLADGDLSLPIKARYPIDEVATAYKRLADRHGLGKIVLQVGAGI
jgi:NADPH:quinone reductase-like Zn-dependent oxidoreductase